MPDWQKLVHVWQYMQHLQIRSLHCEARLTPSISLVSFRQKWLEDDFNRFCCLAGIISQACKFGMPVMHMPGTQLKQSSSHVVAH